MVTTPNKYSNQLQEVYTSLSAFITVLLEHQYCTRNKFQ